MIRRVTALVLMLTMTTAVAMRFPVFGFCLCQEKIVFNQSCCEISSKKSCSSCCQEAAEEPSPCDDCHRAFVCEVDDFVPSAEVMVHPPVFIATSGATIFSEPVRPIKETWRPTLSQPPPPGLPLFLRHQVVRL